MLSTIKIEDFDRFWTTFSTKGAEKRKEYGSRGARVFRDPNADDRVWVVLDMDEEGFESLLENPEMPEIFQEAGIQGVPQAAERAGQTDF